jgi:membrane associated rhomboid family serine protease
MPLYNRDYMREPADWHERRWSVRHWSMVGWVMLAMSMVFVVQFLLIGRGFSETGHIAIFGDASFEALGRGELWRLLTYSFVHDGPLHFALNLLGLWFVGRLARKEFGRAHWLSVFLIGGITGGLAYVVVFQGPQLVGASAAIYSLLAAVTVRMPNLPLGFAFLPGISLRLRNLTLGILTFELISAIAQIVDMFHADALVLRPTQVASLAHLGGAFGGFLYVKLLTHGFNSTVRESDRRERLWREERIRRREPTRVAAGRVAAESEPSDVAAGDFMEDRVNPILEKLHSHGRGSLSQDEQRILDEAARRLRRNH